MDTITDNISLLTEFEAFGVQTHANIAFEPPVTQSYLSRFYINAASRIKRNSTGLAINWWLAFPRSLDTSSFVAVNNTGATSFINSGVQYAVSPFFTVG